MKNLLFFLLGIMLLASCAQEESLIDDSPELEVESRFSCADGEYLWHQGDQILALMSEVTDCPSILLCGPGEQLCSNYFSECQVFGFAYDCVAGTDVLNWVTSVRNANAGCGPGSCLSIGNRYLDPSAFKMNEFKICIEGNVSNCIEGPTEDPCVVAVSNLELVNYSSTGVDPTTHHFEFFNSGDSPLTVTVGFVTQTILPGEHATFSNIISSDIVEVYITLPKGIVCKYGEYGPAG